ncbi:Aldehyde dehydrogenase [Pseudonocardia sp. Ae168_Ps1]|uniref:aldehyde dehydrogenase family protein n=1 Tax=unclassified Pseudonocardia TaxID=2619320 RepID=UPI00094B7552|nr:MULTISPECIES: aldehyde dehydrogenase family protein [unclassified Pseudonocardia]OLL72003.1 Aldehyde dehydrogenase [Pseudonocardia sp. Ae150A_Ps1]OLL77970.1 Aldehyde dehydrogenase [Pseudonocardia sp. Ae168_Ps1]OLL87907.1 Aldehyde dehydrogenase [Pseudonocardia sp. Ae263_Ps1]OLL92068.1 Aldehyde dehydrogenase [Pseudonocardia sp. Ae356_Ps1]
MTTTPIRPLDRLYIDGRFTDATGDGTVAVLNPATEEVLAEVAQGSVADTVAAITAARRAFDDGPWPRMRPAERASVLARMADALQSRYDALVDLNVAEAGSTRAMAHFLQVATPIEHLRDMADRALPGYSFAEPMAHYAKPGFGLGSGVIRHEPAGVAALIIPFNYPLFLNVMKVAPALAAGCTAVLKPSPYTPLEALVLGEIAEEAGLPPGVLNVVTGDTAAAEELTRNPMVDVVSFTGSDAIGRLVYTQAADSLKTVVLELGGKSANVILPDCDIQGAAASVVQGLATHAGQGCSLLTRTLVHRAVHDELVAAVTAMLESVVVGNPADEATTMGPLIRESQRASVEAAMATARHAGAEFAFGGGRPAHLDKGFFLEPTLITGVTNDMEISRTELFGPVGVVIAFDDEEEGIRLANDSEYGLGGGVWSGDPNRALAVAERIRAGYININGGGPWLSPHGPFGGYKNSGVGREWGEFGIGEYLVDKSITWSAR